jgi:hypothetical protein
LPPLPPRWHEQSDRGAWLFVAGFVLGVVVTLGLVWLAYNQEDLERFLGFVVPWTATRGYSFLRADSRLADVERVEGTIVKELL